MGEGSCSSDSIFYVDEHTQFRTIRDLLEGIRNMPDSDFQRFVDPEKNDFSVWIRHSLKNPELAESISRTRSREKIIDVLTQFLNPGSDASADPAPAYDLASQTVVIVGGNAAGLSAAARLRRLSESLNIIVLEKTAYTSFANCGMPYCIGKKIKSKKKIILNTPETLKVILDIDVRINSEVVSIDRDNKKVFVKDLNRGTEYALAYDKLVLSPGAKPFTPDIKGIKNKRTFSLRSIDDMEKIMSSVDNAKAVTILGGGFIGIELAENFRALGLDVNIIELRDHMLSAVFDKETASLIQKELWFNGVKLFLDESINEVVETENGLKLMLRSGETLNTDILISSVGVTPDISFLDGSGIETGRGVIVDENLQTNDPDIFAIGDAIEVVQDTTKNRLIIPLAGPANYQGRIVADIIMGDKNKKYSSTLGTSICKVFSLTAAATGASEYVLKKSGIAFNKVYLYPPNHAVYYPGASKVCIKLMFSDGGDEDGKLLGAQIIGHDGVDKYIDVISYAIRSGMPVYSFSDAEFAYAPPYGSAKSPLNLVAYICENIRDKKVEVVSPEEINSDDVLLDVRTSHEFMCGHIEGSINIDLHELRDRIKEIPKDKRIVVYCAYGQRGYFAYRILKQKGFNCCNLNGGYETYLLFNETHNYREEQSIFIDEKHIHDKIQGAKCTLELDACGIKCPGPIIKLQKAVSKLKGGETVKISANDPSFARDIPEWCKNTGNTLHGITKSKEKITAFISVGKDAPTGDTVTTDKDSHGYIADGTENNEQDKHIGISKSQVQDSGKAEAKGKITFMVTTDDLKKVSAALMSATIADSLDSEIVLFFIYDGIRLILKNNDSVETVSSKARISVKDTEIAECKDPDCTSFSIHKYIKDLSNKKVLVCAMVLDLLGYTKEDLIDGVELSGMMSFYNEMSTSKNTFII